MDILQIVMPVLVMIILGMLCRKWKILTGEGVANMKVLVTNVMLPVAIFHALATAEYNKETGILILIMLIMLVVSFSLGFVLKPFLKGKYQRYLPFMVSVYEGGLMAHVAVLDIAGLLFGFSIYMGMLGQVEDGGKIDVKKLFSSAIRTPAFIASVLGIIAGLSKIIIILLDSPFGGVYQSVENILTTSVTAIILLVVGYSMELNANLLKPCITTILIRMILQGVMMAGVLFAVHSLVGDSQIVNLAIITYMSSPATFSMQTFMKDEEGSAYVSTTNSMYCLVSILVYIILAVTIC